MDIDRIAAPGEAGGKAIAARCRQHGVRQGDDANRAVSAMAVRASVKLMRGRRERKLEPTPPGLRHAKAMHAVAALPDDERAGPRAVMGECNEMPHQNVVWVVRDHDLRGVLTVQPGFGRMHHPRG